MPGVREAQRDMHAKSGHNCAKTSGNISIPRIFFFIGQYACPPSTPVPQKSPQHAEGSAPAGEQRARASVRISYPQQLMTNDNKQEANVWYEITSLNLPFRC